MTTIQQMQDLLTHIGTRVHELCIHSTEFPNIDEWEGYGYTYDIHFENQDNMNILNVVVYGLKVVEGTDFQQTDPSNIFHTASYDIKRTREANKPMEARTTGDITKSLVQEAVKSNSITLDDGQINELAKTIAGFVVGDGIFRDNIKRSVYENVQYEMVDRIDRIVNTRVDHSMATLSRTEIVNELVEHESFMNGNFIRGMMDNARFRTFMNNIVHERVNSMFTDGNSWLSEMMDEAIERKTRLMVNETVERSLKVIASRISAGSDV
jgi:hypothetical protein